MDSVKSKYNEIDIDEIVKVTQQKREVVMKNYNEYEWVLWHKGLTTETYNHVMVVYKDSGIHYETLLKKWNGYYEYMYILGFTLIELQKLSSYAKVNDLKLQEIAMDYDEILKNNFNNRNEKTIQKIMELCNCSEYVAQKVFELSKDNQNHFYKKVHKIYMYMQSVGNNITYKEAEQKYKLKG